MYKTFEVFRTFPQSIARGVSFTPNSKTLTSTKRFWYTVIP